MAEDKTNEIIVNSDSSGMIAIAAGLAIGLSALAAAYSQAKIGSSFAAALVEKPELGGSMILYLLIPETIVLFGLIISILLYSKI